MLLSYFSRCKSLCYLFLVALSLTACSSKNADDTAAAAQAEVKKELIFGIIGTESSQNLKKDWEPMLEDMSKSIGLEVKPFFASDYAGVIQAMRFGKVDIAWYGNKSAMEAVDRADGEVFAQVVMDDGSTGYKSVLIVHKDSPLNSVDDVLANAGDLIFGNGDPNSTSGYLVPGYYIFGKNNVKATDIFKRTLNSNHESNAMAVLNKQLDVATFNTGSWDLMEMRRPGIFKDLKIIWESPEIAADPIVWRKDLSDELKKKITSFFFSYGSTPKEKAILKTLTWSNFRASTNAQLQPIRDLEAFKQSQAK